MGLSHSPSIVTDGLDFYIDPNNTRCYPGFGNTVYNIVNSSIGATLVGFTSALLDSTEARSFFFDGSNDSLPFSNSTSYSPTKITVCIWFKKAHGSSFKALIDKGRDNYGAWSLCVDETANRASFKAKIFYTSGVNQVITTSSNYNSNAWNFVCGVYDGAYLSIYLNGVLSNSAYYLHELGNNSYPITVGAANDGYNVNANIGQAFIYGRALSAAEINQNYHATKKKYLIEENIVTNGLILNLDPGNPNSYSGAGNTIYDLSGSGNTGTLINSPTFSSLNGGQINMPGSSKYIDLGQKFNFISENFSISTWVYLDSFVTINNAGQGPIPFFKGDFQQMGYFSQIASDGSFVFCTNQGGVTQISTSSVGIMTTSTWYNLAFVRNGSSVRLYLNGIDRTSTGASHNNPGSSNQTFKINYYKGDYLISGQMRNSQFLIYNRALSATEIQQNYNATKGRFLNALPPVRNGLVLELDALSYSGFGNTWYNLAGSGLNGTLTNGIVFSATGNTSSFTSDGVNDRIDFGTVPANTTGTATVGCWVKTTTTTQCMTVSFESYGSIYINRFTTGKILAFFDGSTGNNTSADVSNTSVNDGKWHYIAATNNGTTCSMYIDGILDKTYSETPSYSTGIYNQISGQTDGNNHMNGSISFAHIYNRALSAYEIKQNFDYYRTRYGI
jgi:hypothetical protein